MEHIKWTKQEEKDIFSEALDWSDTCFTVIMKDGTERRVVAWLDEGMDGSVNAHWDLSDTDDVVDFEEILLWRKI